MRCNHILPILPYYAYSKSNGNLQNQILFFIQIKLIFTSTRAPNMPRSPYRRSQSQQKGKRDYRKVQKTSQDRYYNEPKKKVQRTYDYPDKPRDDDKDRRRNYDERPMILEPYEQVPVIRIDTKSAPQPRRTQPQSEIKIHFRFRHLKIKLNQRGEDDLKHKLKSHISEKIGPVAYFQRSLDSAPGYLILELGFVYDSDALAYLEGKFSQIDITVEKQKVLIQADPTKTFKRLIDEMNHEKKKSSKHEDKKKSRSRSHSGKKQKSKHKKKKSVSSSRSNSSSDSSPSRKSRRSRRSHEDRHDKRKHDRQGKDPYQKDRKDYRKDDQKNDYKDDRREDRKDQRKNDYKDPRKNECKDDRKIQHRQYKDDRKIDYKEERKSDYKEDRKSSYKEDRKSDYKEDRRGQYRREDSHRQVPQRQPSKQDRRQPYQRQRPRQQYKPRIQQRIKDVPASPHQKQPYNNGNTTKALQPVKPAENTKETVKQEITLYFFGIHYSVNSKDMDKLFKQNKDGPFIHKELIWRQMKDSICVYLEGRFQKKHALKLLQIADKLQVKGHPFVIVDSDSALTDKLLQKIAQYQIIIQFPRKVEPYHLLKGMKECGGRVVQIMSNNKMSQQGRCQYYNVTFNSKQVCTQMKALKRTSSDIIIEEVTKENALYIFRPNSQTELMTVDYESENKSNPSPKREYIQPTKTNNFYDYSNKYHDRNYDKNYSKPYEKNYDRNYDKNYGKSYDNNYGKSYDNNNAKNYNKDYDKNYDKNNDRNRDKSSDRNRQY